MEGTIGGAGEIGVADRPSAAGGDEPSGSDGRDGVGRGVDREDQGVVPA